MVMNAANELEMVAVTVMDDIKFDEWSHESKQTEELFGRTLLSKIWMLSDIIFAQKEMKRDMDVVSEYFTEGAISDISDKSVAIYTYYWTLWI